MDTTTHQEIDEVEACIACLGDDAASLRNTNPDCDIAANMDDAARRLREMKTRHDALVALINTPELEQFLRATHIEAVHQVNRWGIAHDRAKRPADWFWLVGYLGGKALHSAIANDRDKARHHTISTAAALYNWHCSIQGLDVRMCPGRSDGAAIVDGAFPGEAAS